MEKIEIPNDRYGGKKGGPKARVLSEDDYKKVAGVGRKKQFVSPMSDTEKKRLGYYKKIAKKRRIELTSLEKYNVFGPEVEAREFVGILFNKKGNLVSAVKQFFPMMQTATVEECHVKGMDIISSKRVQELIKEGMKVHSVDVNWVVTRIVDIADKEGAQDKDRLRALEMLGNFAKVFDTKKVGGNTVNYNLNISEDAAKRLLERRTRYDIIEGGEFAGVQGGDGRNDEYGEEESDRLFDSNAERLCT